MNRKIPELEYTIEPNNEKPYCLIRVTTKNVDIYFNSFQHFKYILRTRTALGNTANLFLEEDKREKLEINVNLIDDDGQKFEDKIPYLYLHFDELVKGNYPIFDAEYSTRNKKWIIDTAEVERKPRGILRLVDYDQQIYLTFCQAEFYEKFGAEIGLDRYPEDIIVSIKGCPTSVFVNKPRLGNAGYYTNIHAVINDNRFILDAGRKTIRHEDAEEVRNRIKSFFNDLVKLSGYFMSTPHDSIGEGAGLEQIKERAKQTDDLKIKGIPFKKVPRHEQSVVGIFHEMLGAGQLKGYRTLLVSQYNTFDLLFEYEIPIEEIGENPRKRYLKGAGKGVKKFEIISFGEFKQNLSSFCKDVDSEIKGMEHVDLIICWESNNLPKGWELRKIYNEERVYKGANYILEKIGFKKFHVMMLKDFHDS